MSRKNLFSACNKNKKSCHPESLSPPNLKTWLRALLGALQAQRSKKYNTNARFQLKRSDVSIVHSDLLLNDIMRTALPTTKHKKTSQNEEKKH